MSKKRNQLEILNVRRSLLIENIERFNIERARIQSRLNNVMNHLESAELELAAIDTQLNTLAKKDCFKVKLHTIHGAHETNVSKLMLEINLEGHPPIYKLISDFDTLLYSRKDNPKDKLVFESRLKDIAEEWLSKQESISRLFDDIGDNLMNVLDKYIDDPNFDRRIRRGSVFFPIIAND